MEIDTRAFSDHFPDHWHADPCIVHIARMLHHLQHAQERIMATLADIQAAVADETTVIAGVVTLLDKLAADLAAAIAGGNDPAALQSLLDTIVSGKQQLADAVARDTPAAPAPAA